MFASKDLFLTRPSGGYQISRSVRLRSSASGYFNRSFTTPTSQQKGTFSFWLKRGALGARNNLFSNDNGTQYGYLEFDANNLLSFSDPYSAGACSLITTQVFRDPSAWYHIILAFDTTQATSTNRAKFYVNGVQITSFGTAVYPTQNANLLMLQAGSAVQIAAFTRNGTPTFDGYLTEFNFIDGQALTPSSFGQTNSVTGVWQPIKYTGTYGTNGFYLNFSDNSNNTATTIGKDYSGNGNNWTPNNISVTAGTTYDSMIDVPTPYADGSTGRGNYATLNPLDKTPASTTITASNGNLQVTSTNAGTVAECMASTIAIPANSGKWYWECQFTTENDAVGTPNSGIIDASLQITSDCYLGSSAAPASIGFSCDGQIRTPTGNTSYTNPTSSQVVGFAYDSSNGKLWVAVAGTWQNSGDPAAGTGQVATASWYANGAKVANSSNRSLVTVFNFGQRPFTYTPPSGFNALNTQNLPTPTISNGATVMAASTYTGTGATQTIANSGNNAGSISFQPDLVWIKSRSAATNNNLFDSVRGTTNYLISNSTAAAATNANTLTAFGTTGFTLGSDASALGVNVNAATYVAWQWQAGQGSTSSNTSGSITSTVSVNATAGFSVVTYTTTGSAGTVGHGLGVAPSMIILKNRSGAVDDWYVYHASLGNTKYLTLDTTAAATTAATWWNSTSPTSTVFSLGSAWSVVKNYVAYCFAPVAGYSAFGSYTGNGSADGPFIYTGFRPRWVMIKRTDTTDDWIVMDSSRNTYNVANSSLFPNGSFSETTDANRQEDFLSNGFKVRSSPVYINASGGTYIYAAFAENPFKLSLAR